MIEKIKLDNGEKFFYYVDDGDAYTDGCESFDGSSLIDTERQVSKIMKKYQLEERKVKSKRLSLFDKK